MVVTHEAGLGSESGVLSPTGKVPVMDDYVQARSQLSCVQGGRSCGMERTVRGRKKLVSVVTVTFNSERTLSRTIDAVVAQSYPEIEYIVIDGGSSDGTVGILKRREREIDLWISEKDQGISDAFNKGIALSRGEYIALINSDDWIEPEHISQAVQHLEREMADFVFGDLLICDKNGALKFTLAGDSEYQKRVRYLMPDINHPSVVCRRDVYLRHGLYDKQIRIAMDYDWLLRGYIKGVRGRYVSLLRSHMSDEGISNRNIRGTLAEVRKISVRHGYPSAAAWIRFCGRIVRWRIRLLIERWISRGLAERLRAEVHPGYHGNRYPPQAHGTYGRRLD